MVVERNTVHGRRRLADESARDRPSRALFSLRARALRQGDCVRPCADFVRVRTVPVASGRRRRMLYLDALTTRRGEPL
ncbi:hypothetical protein J2X41_001993 [Caulobacter sp. BE254]|nr:hypothetical protein [Caulobacter sp. BE254]